MNPSKDIKAKYTWLRHAHGFASNLRSVKGTPNISTSHLLKWATVVAGPCTGDTLMSWQSAEKLRKRRWPPIVLERCRKNGNLGNHYCDDKINFNCFSLFSVSAQVLWGRSIQPQSESWSIASSACAARNAQPVHSAKRECLSTCFQRRRCIRMHPGITNIYIAIIATLFFRLICSLEVWALLCPTMSGQLQSLQSWKTFKKKQGQFQFEDDVYIIKWFLSNHWSKTKTGKGRQQDMVTRALTKTLHLHEHFEHTHSVQNLKSNPRFLTASAVSVERRSLESLWIPCKL